MIVTYLEYGNITKKDNDDLKVFDGVIYSNQIAKLCKTINTYPITIFFLKKPNKLTF